MAEILMKAASFVAIIAMGYCLRRAGFFKESDFGLLSKIVLKITLPAAIVTNFSKIELDPSMLGLALPGFLGGAFLILLALALNAHRSRDSRAFDILNLSGYNIGNFTMPFAQGFLGPMGVAATSLFDTGNAFVCLGGSYSLAVIAKGEKGGFSVQNIVRTMLRSVPFDTYLFMTILSLLHWRLSECVVNFSGIVGGANSFMAMLMIGVGFKVSGSRSQTGRIVKTLAIRYGVSAALAAAYLFLLPIGLEYRQALVILAFSPIASSSPAYTGLIKGDVGLASAINSLSIVISLVLITGALLLML